MHLRSRAVLYFKNQAGNSEYNKNAGLYIFEYDPDNTLCTLSYYYYYSASQGDRAGVGHTE